MNRFKFFPSIVTAFLLLAIFSSTALAHDEIYIQQFGSFVAGLTYPVLGLDHLLAMLAVGIVSAQIGGRAIWLVPCTFVLMLLIGGLLGLTPLSLPPIEFGVGLSVLVLGVAIAANFSLSIIAALAGVAIFAIFNGYTQYTFGAEMLTIGDALRYLAGFLISTAMIHLVGVLLGDIPTRFDYQRVSFGVMGIAIALFGLSFLSQAM